MSSFSNWARDALVFNDPPESSRLSLLVFSRRLLELWLGMMLLSLLANDESCLLRCNLLIP